jgi:hypothetical protein
MGVSFSSVDQANNLISNIIRDDITNLERALRSARDDARNLQTIALHNVVPLSLVETLQNDLESLKSVLNLYEENLTDWDRDKARDFDSIEPIAFRSNENGSGNIDFNHLASNLRPVNFGLLTEAAMIAHLSVLAGQMIMSPLSTRGDAEHIANLIASLPIAFLMSEEVLKLPFAFTTARGNVVTGSFTLDVTLKNDNPQSVAALEMDLTNQLTNIKHSVREHNILFAMNQDGITLGFEVNGVSVEADLSFAPIQVTIIYTTKLLREEHFSSDVKLDVTVTYPPHRESLLFNESSTLAEELWRHINRPVPVEELFPPRVPFPLPFPFPFPFPR